MQEKLRGNAGFETYDDKYDAIALLKSIKACVYDLEDIKDAALALIQADKKLKSCFQIRDTSLADHKERFDALVAVLEGHAGSVGVHPKLLKDELDLLQDHERKEEANVKVAKVDARDRALAMLFLTSGDRTRYGSMLLALENDKLKGFDNYPKTLEKAYTLMLNYKQGKKLNPKGQLSDSVTFVNKGTKDKSEVNCYNCGELAGITPTSALSPKRRSPTECRQ